MIEIWKDVTGYEGLYQVSNLGKIKSFVMWDGHNYIKKERILNPYKQQANKNYYRSVIKLTKDGLRKSYKIHRLVAEAFIPNPNKYQIVNHKDGNPLNNNVDNLEWCTQKYNVNYAIETDTNVRTIDTIDRETIVDMLNSNFTYDEIAKELGIAKGTVFNYIKKFNIRKIYE